MKVVVGGGGSVARSEHRGPLLARTHRLATANPMPRDAPVMKNTLPRSDVALIARLLFCFSLVACRETTVGWTTRGGPQTV